MTSGDYPYPPDEFDSAGTRIPEGAHRKTRSLRSRVAPLVIVMILFPLLAYGLVTWLSDEQGRAGGALVAEESGTVEEPPTDPATDPAAEPTTPAPAPPAEEPPVETPTAEPAPVIDLDRAVEVYNSTGTSGLAARGAAAVEDAGFTAVTAGNWSGRDPSASVVYYPAAADLATAQAVAAALGIDAVQESADVAREGIVVVLAADYRP